WTDVMFKNGSGLLPLPWKQVEEIPAESSPNDVADFTPNRHPIFAPVFDVKNSILDSVQIEFVVQPDPNWNPLNSDAQILANVRGKENKPLVVETSFGKGRVISFLTTAGPDWNNWCRNATYPAIQLLMEDYLAAGRYDRSENFVGDTFRFQFPRDEVQKNFVYLSPISDKINERSFETKTLQILEDSYQTTIGGKTSNETNRAGIYDFWFQKPDSSYDVQRLALNPDVRESRLKVIEPQQFELQLGKMKMNLVPWDAFSPEPVRRNSSSLGLFLLTLFLMLWILETLLAYSNSYAR
ncbi:MAG: hypothetical protein AAF939_16315, partial [Planctomycetota bacterium]